MTMTRPVAAVTALLAGVALALASAAPAQAADPVVSPDGLVTIGDAYWQFDEYGIQYGWDVANVYDPSGYIEYAGYIYGGDDYVYCGDGTLTDGTVTIEANGDLTIVCPSHVWGSSGLTAQWSFRVYQPSATGYLVRQFLTVANTTTDPITLTTAHSINYYDGYTGTEGTPGFLTSLGGNTVDTDDTWYVSVDATGASVAETNAWALTGSAPASGIAASSGISAVYGPDHNTYAPGETKYFVAFTNMVIPTTQDGPGAEAAFDASVALTDEFASFSGRLISGLPNDITVIGWGATPVTPALANTGAHTQGTLLLLGSTAGILALAGGLLFAAARARSRSRA